MTKQLQASMLPCLLFTLSACGVSEGTALANEQSAVSYVAATLSAPMILEPMSEEVVLGPSVHFAGTSQEGSEVTVFDSHHAKLCTATTDASGAWSCSAMRQRGAQTVLAQASVADEVSPESPATHFYVIIDELETGGGCTSTGAQAPAALLALVLLAWWRRS